MSLTVRARARIGALALDVELDTGPGTLVVVGPNGAGKSSLLALVLGALHVEQGRVAVGDTVLVDTDAGIDLPLEQRRLGWVPQSYALFPHLSVRGNVELALSSSAQDPRRRAAEILDELGLSSLAERLPRTLSGGEKQRVALARALAIRPRALLLDEPLAALDAEARQTMRSYLAESLANLALPTLVVTHDASDARVLGSRIAVLEAGRIVQMGTLGLLTERPASPFVERLFAS